MGDLESNFFFDEIFFLPSYFENNRHVFFFQCDTSKSRDIIFFFIFPFQNFACILKKLQQNFRNKKIGKKLVPN